MKYLRAVFNVLFAFLLFAIAVPLVLLMIILSFGTLRNYAIQHIGGFIGRTVLRAAGIRFEIEQVGAPINQPAVYLINHSSTIDLFVMIGLGLPRIRFIAKYELQYNPLFFMLGRLTDQIFIKRQDTEKAVDILQRAYKKILDNELSVLFAPEGSRKHEGVIGPFKKGAFRMAIDLNYPIVPIYLSGAQRLNAEKSLISKSGKVVATIHPPIDTRFWKPDTLDDHIAEVRKMYLRWAGIEMQG
ncbi:MAG TPA: lysophospholipid acyltransferase family protein [Balneolales bacterium]|nr:lysophospholipid acyltransferase family protein [Balneolales bacterium]